MTESKPLYFTFATAGHVDHGKTSLLRALTGIDPDRLKEEKQRQMTTDIGFAHLNFPQESDGTQLVIGFIDVPGHGKFLKNMLAGVGGIQMALLVVAADEGPMPQTISHVKILSLLGVRKALVALTKIDMAPDERQSEVDSLARSLLERYGIECMGVVRISNTENKGFDELKSELQCVAQLLERPKNTGGAALPIDRVFSKSGYGVVVTGTLVSGKLKVGDTISIQPGDISGRIRGLETFKRQLQEADAGQRLAVNLSLKENKALERGQVVTSWGAPVVTTLIVRIEQIGVLSERVKESDLKDQHIRLYHGTAECAGQLRWCQKLEGEKDAHAQQSDLIAQIVLTDPVVAQPGDRFVVRYGDEGITGGVILTTARPRWLTRNKLVPFVSLLIAQDYVQAIDFILDNMSQPAVKAEAFSAFVPYEFRDKSIDAAIADASAVKTNDFVYSSKRAQEMKERIVKILTPSGSVVSSGDGDVYPLEHSLESVRMKISGSMDRQVFQSLVKELSDAGRVTRTGDKIILTVHSRSILSPQQEAQAKEILKILDENICLEIDEISKRINAQSKNVTAILQQLAKENCAQIVDFEFASSTASLAKCHEALAKIFAAKKEISPSDFRETMGTSRKYAMALLAYFDKNLVTRRLNNTRVLLKNPKTN
ncbi:MAG TPA: selenocysteine-specific translation elongation factor [Drouetiella sp.]